MIIDVAAGIILALVILVAGWIALFWTVVWTGRLILILKSDGGTLFFYLLVLAAFGTLKVVIGR